MRDYESGEPTPALLTGARRLFASFALLAVTLAMTVAAYGGPLSGGAEDTFRFGLPLVLGAAVLTVGASKRSKAFRPLLLSLLHPRKALWRRSCGETLSTPRARALR
jgi:hypothetical protein